jgi:hypothetical protein
MTQYRLSFLNFWSFFLFYFNRIRKKKLQDHFHLWSEKEKKVGDPIISKPDTYSKVNPWGMLPNTLTFSYKQNLLKKKKTIKSKSFFSFFFLVIRPRYIVIGKVSIFLRDFMMFLYFFWILYFMIDGSIYNIVFRWVL